MVRSGDKLTAIPLVPLQALILSLRIADSLGQHLAQLSFRLRRLARWFLPCCHEPYVGMRPVELNPRSELLLTVHVRFRALNGLNSDIAPCAKRAMSGPTPHRSTLADAFANLTESCSYQDRSPRFAAVSMLNLLYRKSPVISLPTQSGNSSTRSSRSNSTSAITTPFRMPS